VTASQAALPGDVEDIDELPEEGKDGETMDRQSYHGKARPRDPASASAALDRFPQQQPCGHGHKEPEGIGPGFQRVPDRQWRQRQEGSGEQPGGPAECPPAHKIEQGDRADTGQRRGQPEGSFACAEEGDPQAHPQDVEGVALLRCEQAQQERTPRPAGLDDGVDFVQPKALQRKRRAAHSGRQGCDQHEGEVLPEIACLLTRRTVGRRHRSLDLLQITCMILYREGSVKEQM
jgi:hypothetical protein